MADMLTKKIICILSVHFLGDNRIMKYTHSFYDSGMYHVKNIHFLGDIFKEENNEIQFPITNNPIKKRLYFFSRKYKIRILKYLKAIFEKNDNIIFHIHDPIVLNLSRLLKQTFKNSLVFYDRHEYYEQIYTKKIFREYFFYELLNKKYIDRVIVISDLMKDKVKNIFTHKKISVVHNFPTKDRFDNRQDFFKRKNDVLTILYVGSLNWNTDRDVALMLKLTDIAERSKVKYNFYMAGPSLGDIILLDKLQKKEKETNGRFKYLGVISRDKTIEYTKMAHIGLCFLYPWYLKQVYSSNKIFDYLYFGVIAFARISVADINIKEYYDYIFEKNISEDIIENKFYDLITNRDYIDSKIKKLLEKKYDFFWEYDIYKLLNEINVSV
jgi:hypothetical protein